MNTSEYRKKILYRKAQGNIYKKAYFNKISSLINTIINPKQFLSLEDTDRLIESINEKKVSSRINTGLNNYLDIVEFINKKNSTLPFYLLIDEEWKYCGAYKTSGKISSNYNFDELTSDEIRIISCDMSYQIQIDYDNDEIECECILYE
jgi:hypothetical protein